MPLFKNIISQIDSLGFFIVAELAAIIITLYAIFLLCIKQVNTKAFLHHTKHILIIILLASITEDLSWLINVLKLTIWKELDNRLVVSLIRVAWILSIIQYQAFSLFIEYLIPSQSKFLLIINRLTWLICTLYCIIFTWLIIFKTIYLERPAIEVYIFDTITYIYMPILISICLFFTLIALSDRQIPSILRHIAYTFMLGLIGPSILVDLIHIYHPNLFTNCFAHDYIIIALFALLIALSAHFCIRKLLYLDSNKTLNLDNTGN
jgi:hypothetical protein